MKRAVAAAAVLAAIAAGVTVASRPTTVRVPAGTAMQDAVADASAGSVLRLEPGVHTGPIVIDKKLTLEADSGAVLAVRPSVEAALTITADDVHVQGLVVEGAVQGISVREAEDVVLEDVTVTGARLHGIEVVDASARISGARITNMISEYAQGIEVRYADNHPRTVVENSLVEGGQEGIVSHVAHVEFSRNIVRGTTMRAVAISEMSHGIARSNLVEDAAGAGLYCGDMSMCEFSGNEVKQVAEAGVGSQAGWGLAVNYRSRASTDNDSLAGEAGGVGTFVHSLVRDRSPFELGRGWRAVPNIVATALLALLVLFLVTRGSRWALDRVAAGARRNPSDPARYVVPLFVVGLAVQSFHLVEHALQVYRVHIDGVPSKGGIVGPSVEAEWIHFVYNAAVLVGIAAVAAGRARGWRPRGEIRTGDALLGAAVALQSYHMVEHSVKLLQHLQGGAKVNPGLAGAHVDLVLLHFGINLAVYLAVAGAATSYAFSASWTTSIRRFLTSERRSRVLAPLRRTLKA